MQAHLAKAQTDKSAVTLQTRARSPSSATRIFRQLAKLMVNIQYNHHPWQMHKSQQLPTPSTAEAPGDVPPHPSSELTSPHTSMAAA
ncbi:hypothetical protein F1880_007986 [Penicillium rolfsii]|nr:hypothetical protein F1880_007986 [Penicillium rolfsii]